MPRVPLLLCPPSKTPVAFVLLAFQRQSQHRFYAAVWELLPDSPRGTLSLRTGACKRAHGKAFRSMAAATAANVGKVDSKSFGSMMHRFHISSVAPGRTPDRRRLLPVLEHVKQIDMMPSQPGGHIVSPSVTGMLRNEHEHRWGTGCIRPSSTFFTHTNIFLHECLLNLLVVP